IFQTVMDDEIIGMARVMEQGIEVNDETLGLDVMDKIGPGGHYLYEDHTMKWFRKHWRPTLMDRRNYEEWSSNGSESMKERIIKKTRDILENHEGPSVRVPADVKKDIEKVVKEAEERVEREGL
ncbi:MAG: trimethylamine methyltransferase family protein, partial [Thermodesulfobacteriota bacterium]